MENALRFLHGMELRREHDFFEPVGFVVIAGAVVWRQTYHDLPQKGSHDVIEKRSYEDLFGERPLLKLSLPKAAELLAFPRNDRRKLPDSGRPDFARALGEACADDDAGFAELTKQFDAAPDDDLTIALGWSHRPAAVERLVARCRSLAWAPDAEKDRQRTCGAMSSTAFALRHADPGSFDLLLRDLTESRGDRVVAFLGEDALLRRRLAAVDAASFPAARRSALYRLCDLDAMRGTGAYRGELPPGDEGRRVLHALLEAIDSGEPTLRRAALTTVEWYVFQSAAGPEIALRRLVEDVDAARVTIRRLSWEGTTPPSTTSAAEVAVRWMPDGLRLRISNVSDRPFLLNRTALRHAMAYRGAADGRRDSNGEFLHVVFDDGILTFSAATLILVRPHDVEEVILPMREEFRGAAHQSLSLRVQSVAGGPAAPYLRLDETLDL